MTDKTSLSMRDIIVITRLASALIVVARDIRNHDESHREENINALVAGANLLAMMLEDSAANCKCAECENKEDSYSPSLN